MINLTNVYGNDFSLAEIFQSMDIKFAYVNDKYQRVHQPCKCRDFLGDMIWSRKKGQAIQIYGLSYNFAEHPYDTEVTRFALNFPSSQSAENFKKNIGYIHAREKKYNVPTISKILDTTTPNVLIIESDKVWQSDGWKLSLYTFYIKLMSYDDVANPKSPESRYLKALTPEKEHQFLSHLFSDFPDSLHNELYYSHNYCGFFTALTEPAHSKVAKAIFEVKIMDRSEPDNDESFNGVYYSGEEEDDDDDDDDEYYDDEDDEEY